MAKLSMKQKLALDKALEALDQLTAPDSGCLVLSPEDKEEARTYLNTWVVKPIEEVRAELPSREMTNWY